MLWKSWLIHGEAASKTHSFLCFHNLHARRDTSEVETFPLILRNQALNGHPPLLEHPTRSAFAAGLHTKTPWTIFLWQKHKMSGGAVLYHHGGRREGIYLDDPGLCANRFAVPQLFEQITKGRTCNVEEPNFSRCVLKAQNQQHQQRSVHTYSWMKKCSRKKAATPRNPLFQASTGSLEPNPRS